MTGKLRRGIGPAVDGNLMTSGEGAENERLAATRSLITNLIYQ